MSPFALVSVLDPGTPDSQIGFPPAVHRHLLRLIANSL